MALPRLILPLALAAVAGCAEVPEHLLGDQADGIVALYPADGAAGIPPGQPPFLEMGWAVDDGAPVEARLIPDGGAAVELTCGPSEDRARRVCAPPAALTPDTTYTLQAELLEGGTGPVSTRFTTATPQGASFEVGTGLRVELLGGEHTPVALLNLLFDGSPILMVSRALHPPIGLPTGERSWVWGPGVALPPGADGTHAIETGVGFPFAAHAAVDADGTITGEAAHAFLQVEVADIWHQVRIDDVTFEGTLSTGEDGVPACTLMLAAVLPRISIERLGERAGDEVASILESQLVLDVDTDGDGNNDAAFLLLSSTSAPATIQAP